MALSKEASLITDKEGTERTKKTYEALEEKTHDVTISSQGVGLVVYFGKKIARHFKKNKTIGGTLVRLNILEEDLESRCFVIRNRDEVLAMLYRGHFDVDNDDNPMLIIKPNQSTGEG